MLDVAVAYNRYRFLGNEFLTWIWFVIETDPSFFKVCDDNFNQLDIGNRIVIENRQNGNVETVRITGDEVGLEEGLVALQKGGVVTEMNLRYMSGSHLWQFNIKGESLSIGGLKPPETIGAKTTDEIEASVLERMYLYEKVIDFIFAVFENFIRLRLSEQWKSIVMPGIFNWIRQPVIKPSS